MCHGKIFMVQHQTILSSYFWSWINNFVLHARLRTSIAARMYFAHSDARRNKVDASVDASTGLASKTKYFSVREQEIKLKWFGVVEINKGVRGLMRRL